jgi:hypothetical protein
MFKRSLLSLVKEEERRMMNESKCVSFYYPTSIAKIQERDDVVTLR